MARSGEGLFNRLTDRNGWTGQQQLEVLADFCSENGPSCLVDTVLEWVQQNGLDDELRHYLANLKTRAKSPPEEGDQSGDDMADAIDRYTDPQHPEYDPEFDKQIRELRPDWFDSE